MKNRTFSRLSSRRTTLKSNSKLSHLANQLSLLRIRVPSRKDRYSNPTCSSAGSKREKWWCRCSVQRKTKKAPLDPLREKFQTVTPHPCLIGRKNRRILEAEQGRMLINRNKSHLRRERSPQVKRKSKKETTKIVARKSKREQIKN